MGFQVDIEEKIISNLSEDAQSTLNSQLIKYAEEIVREAILIEEGTHEDGASTEITSNIILQAVHRNKTLRPKKMSVGFIVLKIISTLSLLVAGFLFDPSGYQDTSWKLILFIIFLMIATGTTVAQFVLEERR